MNELKYDIKKQWSFRGGIDETIIASLIGIFVSSVNDEFPAFAEAVAADDRSAIHKIGHKLKGSSANLGFEYFRKLCEDLGDMQERIQILTTKPHLNNLAQKSSLLKNGLIQ